MKQLLRVLVLATMCLASFFSGYKYKEHTAHRIETIIEHEKNRIFCNLIKNSDVLMRLSHYTDEHKTIRKFCPECYLKEDNHDNIVVPPSTPDKVIDQLGNTEEDKNKIYALRSISTTLFIQRMAAQHALNSLRKKAGITKWPPTENNNRPVPRFEHAKPKIASLR